MFNLGEVLFFEVSIEDGTWADVIRIFRGHVFRETWQGGHRIVPATKQDRELADRI